MTRQDSGRSTTSQAKRPVTTSTPVALYLLFALTGVGLALPGTLLPFLTQRWSWQDGRSGWLFLLFFLGTAAGAFVARGKLGRMLVLAAVFIAAPTVMLALVHGLLVPLAMLLIGFGLGLAMTAVSLLRSHHAGNDRGTELTRLNLLWAFGAASAPMLLLRSTQLFGLARTLSGYALVVLLCGFAAGLPLWHEPEAAGAGWSTWRKPLGRVPAVFAVGLPLATGVEAGVGAWLVTYTLRDSAARGSLIGVGTALWAGLLLSRVLFSSRALRLASRPGVVTAFSGLVVCGLLLLLRGSPASAMVLGASFVGFGIGPVYPQLLAAWLDRSEAGNAGFLLAGAGSALLPFLIGEASQHAHSLRVGLLIPLAGAVVLFFTLLRTGGGKRSSAGG